MKGGNVMNKEKIIMNMRREILTGMDFRVRPYI